MNTVPICPHCGGPLIDVTEHMSINIPHHYDPDKDSYDSTICVITRDVRKYLTCIEPGCDYATVGVEEWGEVSREKLLEVFDKIGGDEEALFWLKRRTKEN